MEKSRICPALTAGYCILVIAMMAGYAYGVHFQGLYDPQSAEQSYAQVINHPERLCSFIGLFFGVALLDWVIGNALYQLYRKFFPLLSKVMGGIRMAYAPIFAWSLFPLLFLDTHSAESIQSAFNLFLFRWTIALIPFGVHLVLWGWIIMRSSILPAWIGLVTLVSGILYMAIHSLKLVMPEVTSTMEQAAAIPMALGELLPAIGLLFVAYRSLFRRKAFANSAE